MVILRMVQGPNMLGAAVHRSRLQGRHLEKIPTHIDG